ncbi:P-type Ca2+ transporter type 2A [Sarotherodon galilaeus]
MADRATSGEIKGYKPLKAQVEQLKKAIRLANTGASKAAEKECQVMELEVSKLITSQQKKLSDEIALSLVFQTEGERCEGQLKQLEEESAGHSVNRKTNAAMKDLREAHDKCCKWLFLWNAAKSWMKEDDMAKAGDMVSIMASVKQLKEENKKLEDQMRDLTTKTEETARLSTPKIYPWATLKPSAPPPPYVMPVMTLDGGQVRGPEGQRGTVLGGVVNVDYTSGPIGSQEEEARAGGRQPFSEGGRLEASAADEGPTSPQRGLMSDELTPTEEHLVEQSRQDRGAEVTHTQEEVRPMTELGARPKHKGPPGLGKEGQAQMRRSGGAEKTPAWERWEGEVQGRMHEEPEALLKVFSTLDMVRRTILQGRSKDKIEYEASWSGEEEEGDEEDAGEDGGVESDPGPSITLRNREVKKDEGGKKKQETVGGRRSVFGQSKGKTQVTKNRKVILDRGLQDGPLNLPLMSGSCGEPVYRAYKVRDLEALVKQLPPITEGGASWLRKLTTLTEGEELAIGDFRAIGGRCMLGGGLADVEGLARTTRYANDLPLCEVQSALSNAVREKYPTRNTGAIPKIIWDPKDTPGEFLAKAKEQWLTETGIHPGKEGESRAWFRSAVLAGLPKQVTADLEKNPDFAVADSMQWERHVVHRLQLEQDQVNKQKKELEEAQATLIKLQLGEARDKLNNKKKELKEPTKTVMVARPEADPVPDWPDLDPNLYPDDRWPVNEPRQRRPAGNWGTGGPQRGRGGSGRGGLRARPLGSQPNSDSWNCCFICGAEGHWSRHCPEKPRNYPRQGYPPQARGNNRGGAAYRGTHQAPNPSAAPVAQYPVADWGWDGEQY